MCLTSKVRCFFCFPTWAIAIGDRRFFISHGTSYTFFRCRPPFLKLRRDSAWFPVMRSIDEATMFIFIYLASVWVDRSAGAGIVPANLFPFLSLHARNAGRMIGNFFSGLNFDFENRVDN